MPGKTKRFHELLNRLDALEKEQDAIRTELAPIVQELAIEQSPFNVGDKVAKGTKILTRIAGSLNRYGGKREIERAYYGRKILKDGKSLHGTENKMWDWDGELS